MFCKFHQSRAGQASPLVLNVAALRYVEEIPVKHSETHKARLNFEKSWFDVCETVDEVYSIISKVQNATRAV